ncbi:hypothetical protein mRhiFer1_008210 [Rhinolophus ferrumequinum]|uniref:Uncharacterized protein n=1 Tax=Rhinolophus ferrumequinum TaxID=59479 RepID=A0A7J7W7P7_RHIFE|nr:hypothetical protein mRhiFer1_008210 [Rhinolophus ferrumequinum]
MCCPSVLTIWVWVPWGDVRGSRDLREGAEDLCSLVAQRGGMWTGADRGCAGVAGRAGRKTGREFHAEKGQEVSKAPRSKRKVRRRPRPRGQRERSGVQGPEVKEKGQEASKAPRLNKTEQTCVQWAWQPATSASADWGVVVVGVLGRKRQWVQNGE